MDDITTFAALHSGGRVAVNDDGIRPLVNDRGEAHSAEGPAYINAIRRHLQEGPPLGVYPLFRKDYQRTNEWYVNWLAVDLDGGDSDLTHARNLASLLRRFDVKAFIERSRSKGFHVWVYLRQPLTAQMGREAMLGACRLVDVPVREVYPKQTELEGKGFGNCLLLPFPHGGKAGRQVPIDDNDEPLALNVFVDSAWNTRASAHALRSVHALYQEKHVQNVNQFLDQTGIGAVRHRTDDDFGYIARQIWNGEIREDRSNALYAFACSLFRQNYSDDSVLHWTTELDERVGKFVGRQDRDQRLRDLVTNAKHNTL